MPQIIKDQEAEKLRGLIDAYMAKHGIEHDAEFARRAGIQGSRSMLHQHIKTIKPISIQAAKLYAKALQCDISDFSPRIADLIDTSELRSCTPSPVAKDNVVNHRARNTPSTRERITQEIAAIAQRLDDISLGELLGRAKEIAGETQAKANHAK